MTDLDYLEQLIVVEAIGVGVILIVSASSYFYSCYQVRLRRRKFAKRAPSPDWIKARIDQLPEHDPWLDDQYDWDLR